MKVNKLPIPEKYSSYTEDELTDFDLMPLECADEIWYWYGTYSYDGVGQMLIKSDAGYDIHDCCHCSCYGPTAKVLIIGEYKLLTEIKDKCTLEAYKDIECLINAALDCGGFS